jgi:hypothetical protein
MWRPIRLIRQSKVHHTAIDWGGRRRKAALCANIHRRDEASGKVGLAGKSRKKSTEIKGSKLLFTCVIFI